MGGRVHTCAFEFARRILCNILVKDAMERVNLNLAPSDRERLRRLARESKLREAEYTRMLILAALDQAERAQILRKSSEARTADRIARDKLIEKSMERLRD